MTTAPIAHATDATGDDAPAFVHAAALAACAARRLVSVYADVGGVVPPTPDAGALAQRWGRPIEHQRVLHVCCDDPADTVLDALRRVAPGLVVTGAHARSAFGNLIRGSVGEAIARGVTVPTLIVPNDGRGFADPTTGEIDLRRVLIPASDAATATVGLRAAQALADLAGGGELQIVLLHVGAADARTLAELRTLAEVVTADGDVVDVICRQATAMDACVVVMPTHGHDGLLDAVRGSTTERVGRRAGRPVLSVPLP